MSKENKVSLQTRLVERYTNIIDNVEGFETSINEPLKQSFRINSLKGDREKILSNLRKYDETDWDKIISRPLSTILHWKFYFVG